MKGAYVIVLMITALTSMLFAIVNDSVPQSILGAMIYLYALMGTYFKERYY